jgi:hypothetical protein
VVLLELRPGYHTKQALLLTNHQEAFGASTWDSSS